MRVISLLIGTLLIGSACSKEASTPKLHGPTGTSAFLGLEDGFEARDQQFSDRAKLIGIKAPKVAPLQKSLQFEMAFEILDPEGDFPKVFVHAQAPGARLTQVGADHVIKRGDQKWQRGDIVIDSFELTLPTPWHANKVQVFAGLYEGKQRLKVSGAHDGKNRVAIAKLPIENPTHENQLVASRVQGVMKIDGVLDESIWKKTQRSKAFVSYDGRKRIKNTTTAQLAYDDKFLYLAFRCKDDDIHTPYTKNDDPLYESEAVEIFIDADGDKDEYVELQAAPNGVRFDAAFKGGPRENFDTSYNVDTEIGVTLDGTLNDAAADRSFISEWKIPLAQIKDAKKPEVGSVWHINLFRLDRARRGKKVIRSEASAWQTPLSGDFHNLDRFGLLLFGE